ncbi:hypothetical protein [Myxosarcina sp. GI1]|uniref:hypothetical protein n=1 Tax=Myxosarcina sp. GI1 TaxID=1541065 RepID=UPI000690AE34|nr:hypothetical protein [Myxosarcina sp. GI1]
MSSLSLWFTGTTRTGKTSRLVAEFRDWVRKQSLVRHSKAKRPSLNDLSATVLVFAANNQNRRELNDRLSVAVEGTYPVLCKTPLGFITDEVMLFFPLLFERLQLKAQFPLRLRPETEQELATKLWREQPDWETLCEFDSEYRLVRQTLDLLQLAGASGIPAEDISLILQEGYLGRETSIEAQSHLWQRMGELLQIWRTWCLERGLLSYGLIYELYWRYLLPDPQYQYHLTRRYQTIFADDTDDYPAIARDLFEFLLDRGAKGTFTYNPDGKIRLGLNADPDYLKGLAVRCQIETLPPLNNSLATEFATTAVELVSEEAYLVDLPDKIQSLETISRAELLNQTAEIIIRVVKQNLVKSEEIAIIAPGLDEIARYTLIQTLEAQKIAVAPLNEQRPLISSPVVRALLTLLALIYPDLGRTIDRNAIAEMLTVLSQKPQGELLIPDIDPVRGGLIADYCYHADLQQPYLSTVESFPRWDRLGHQATTAYKKIVEWIEGTKIQLGQTFIVPTVLLDRAIATFFDGGSYFQRDRLAVLRELIETAQHFWEVDRRLRQNEPSFQTQTATVAQFIQLLRRGTITANPRPVGQFQTQTGAVTLATVFQYRSLRTIHRWQFWLDTGSPLWQQGGAATLFGAPLFLKNWSGRTWMPEDDYELDKQRLQRIIRDVLGRAQEKVFLCHSDLGVNGTEQMGALLPLVHSAKPFAEEAGRDKAVPYPYV